MTQKEINEAENRLLSKHRRKPVFADEKPNYFKNKLFGGLFKIASIVIFLNIFGIHWNEKATPFLKGVMSYIVGDETGKFIALLLVAIGHVFLLIMLIKGVYQILTFNQYIDVYEGKNLLGVEVSQTHNVHGVAYSNSSSSNVDKVYGYRNSKMTGMTPDKAAKLYIQTSKLGNNTTHKNVEGYINSKLGGMTPEKGLEFLKGN